MDDKIEIVAGVSEMLQKVGEKILFISNHILVANGNKLTEKQCEELIKIGLMAMKAFLDKLGTPDEDLLRDKINKSQFN